MNRILLILVLLTASLTTSAKKKGDDPTLFIYRYMLVDKKGSPHSIKKPELFLSQKAIERRHRQGLTVNETDLPVSPRYLSKFQIEGVEVIGCSRWQNSVLVRSTDTLLLQQLAQLSCEVHGSASGFFV